jgi:hypothetical protein
LKLPLAFLLLASTATAQQMPDPRQMSGIPRPDEAVKGGTVTVRVIHGDFSHPAPVGTPVHLVAVRADGSTTRTTQTVREDGRAEFSGLAPGGEVAYYAFALLGDDRLESDLIALPPMVGVRLMLVGRKLDEQGVPVGEPADDHLAEDAPAPPAGQVDVGMRGREALPIELVEVPPAGQATPAPVATQTPQEDKAASFAIATFTGVPVGPEHIYVARARQGGRSFQSRPFMLSSKAGARAQILAFGQVLLGVHIGGDLDDDRFRFEARFFLGNLTGIPYDPGKQGIDLPLPVGFAGARLADEAMAQRVKIVQGQGLVWNGVVPPGQREVTVQWTQAVEDGVVDVDLPTPLGIFQGQLILEHLPGTTLVPPPGMQPKVRALDTGREFYVLSGLQTLPGGRLKVRLEGLPQHPRSQWWLRLAISLLVVALCGWAMWMAIRTPAVASEPSSRRRELVILRDRLYDQLVNLEKQRAADRIAADRFHRERGQLVAKLALLHRELDELEPPLSK